jgi:hypothetical protein
MLASKGWLLDTEGLRDLLLAFARQLPDFAKQQLREQFLSAPGSSRLRLFCRRSLDEFVE